MDLRDSVVEIVSRLVRENALAPKEFKFFGSKTLLSAAHPKKASSSMANTPSGIMTGDQAKKKKVGGEALFEIW